MLYVVWSFTFRGGLRQRWDESRRVVERKNGGSQGGNQKSETRLGEAREIFLPHIFVGITAIAARTCFRWVLMLIRPLHIRNAVTVGYTCCTGRSSALRSPTIRTAHTTRQAIMALPTPSLTLYISGLETKTKKPGEFNDEYRTTKRAKLTDMQN